ncbi:Helicase associated domain protein [Streptomyces goshikiensis]|uniref:DEAD/DEAH box helicase n=1 Tax=Streptomyces goshikiensis TaxID=1942 RepID=UPI0037F1CCDC
MAGEAVRPRIREADAEPGLPTGMELRPYQEEIVGSVLRGLDGGGIGQIRMACGSGKTIVGQRAAERLLPSGGTVAVLVPSITLAAQTLAVWGRTASRPLDALAVCGDDTVADSAVHTRDLPVPVTTRTGEITAWLERPSPPGMRLVLCTYKSAPRLADAVLATGPLDLLILDEAHHLAGRIDSATRKILQPARLPARRRLFMTATPRGAAPTADGRDPAPMAGMDDTALFGPVLGTYLFAQGIAEGYLEDYRIAVIGVRDSEARRLLADTATAYVDGPGAPPLQTVVAQVALGRARQQFGIRRALSFHPRVDAAAEFSRTLHKALARSVPAAHDGLYTAHVHGEMGHRVREGILANLEQPEGGWSVISNARCLGEGVDLPAVDAVLFGHPKRSVVDITQAVGRALRRDVRVPGPATIIVPLVVPDEDGEIGDLDPGDYDTLWEVVRALRAHDESLGIALDGRRSPDPQSPPRLPGKITLMMPDGTSLDFIDKVKLLLVRQTTSVWWEGFNEAVRYHEQHQHLLVPADHRTDNGFRLGAWITQRRYVHRRGLLDPARVEKLEAIGMVWDPGAAAFAAHLDSAAAFRAEHGHLRVPQSFRTADGTNLGAWINKQRSLYRAGTLAPDRERTLTTLGIDWALDLAEEAWTTGLAAARRYHREHGHLNAPRDHRTGQGHQLGDWLNTQRLKNRKNTLPPERKTALDALAMTWDLPEARWQQAYTAAQNYHATHGHLHIPHSYTAPDGTKLGSWILHQRQLRSGVKKGGISTDRIRALDALGIRW